MARSPDAVVIGGGLVGLSCARALAAGGRSVVLLERNEAPGREASRAAAGLLVPETERAMGRLGTAEGPGEAAMLELLLESRRRFRAFAEELEAASGRAVHYRADGSLLVALSEPEADALARWAREESRTETQWLDAADARRLEPALGAGVLGALHLPGDHQVDNVELTLAAAEATVGAPGVEVRASTPVAGIVVEAGRARGARLAGGGRVAAEWTVVAAGAWSGGLEGLPRPLPVRPVKGEMVALAPGAGSRIGRIVSVPGAYCVPRDDGRVLVGATVEEAGFDRSLDPAAARALVLSAARAVPGFAEAPVASHWAGFRPGTPDGLPILGEDPDLPGLVYATGHYRNGILLAPRTAEIVDSLTRGGPPPIDLAPFSAGRPGLRPASAPTDGNALVR